MLLNVRLRCKANGSYSQQSLSSWEGVRRIIWIWKPSGSPDKSKPIPGTAALALNLLQGGRSSSDPQGRPLPVVVTTWAWLWLRWRPQFQLTTMSQPEKLQPQYSAHWTISPTTSNGETTGYRRSNLELNTRHSLETGDTAHPRHAVKTISCSAVITPEQSFQTPIFTFFLRVLVHQILCDRSTTNQKQEHQYAPIR